jgi:hypothetical protein
MDSRVQWHPAHLSTIREGEAAAELGASYLVLGSPLVLFPNSRDPGEKLLYFDLAAMNGVTR